MRAEGRTRWAIAEGYRPSESHGPGPAMTSHETACMRNASGQDAAGAPAAATRPRVPRVETPGRPGRLPIPG